jgi:prepilin-type processing-associated H-X9-DG protein
VQKVREAAARLKCANNLKQIGLALHNYHDATGKLPMGQIISLATDDPGDGTTNKHEDWCLSILPFIEQAAINDVWQAQRATTATWVMPVNTARIPVYMCPSDPNAGKIAQVSMFGQIEGIHGNYAGNAGSTAFGQQSGGTNLNGVLYPKSRVAILDIADGTSNTVMVAEIVIGPDAGSTDTFTAGDRRGRLWNAYVGELLFSTQYQPNTTNLDYMFGCNQSFPKAPCNAAGFISPGSSTSYIQSSRSYHFSGVNAAFCDGSVRFVGNTAAGWTVSGSRAGGEVPGDL